jgi:hypothetical protein
MKKVMLFLALLTLVMFLYTCAGTQSLKIVEGYANPGDSRTSYEIHAGRDVSYRKCDSICNDACKRDGLSRVGMTVGYHRYGIEANSGWCLCENIQRDLSHVVNVGLASTEKECSAMAWNAGYWNYIYNSGTRSCGGERTYENLGTAETKGGCTAMAEERGYSELVIIYKSDTKRCYAFS